MEMHHGAHSHSQMQRAKRQASSCSLYGQPATGTTVNAYEATTITWDCSCMGTAVKDIDITLYYYGGGALHAWTDVPCSDNSLTTTFKPNWWNSTLSAELQLQITESDQPVWATTTGLGPSFNVAWNGTTPASISAGNGTQTGVSIESIRANDETGGIAGGKLAAAVTVPLLAAAIAIAAYIFYSRRKVKTDRKRWSAYVDQRMSHYSSAPESFTQEGRPSMHSRVQSHYSNVLGSPDKSGMTGATMTQTGSGRPSLASRPISGYSIASNGNNFAGVGSNNVRMPPMAAQIPAMSNEGHAADAAGPFGDMHSRGYSTSGISAVGSHAEGRPASSFYALDGHTGMDTPTSAGSDPTRKHYGNNKSITSTGRPTSEFARPQGTGVGDRVSRVSFADSSFTGKETTGGNRRSSYFANGPGTASSPNAHRYRASQGNSISGNSIFNMYGGGGKDAPAMPRIPIPAVFNKDRDVTKGVEASTARSLSAEDLAGIVVNNNAPGVYSPESFETAALPASRSADENLESMTSGGDQFLAVGDSNNNNKKHNITISTSMPRLANPQGRQSILSPDDMLRAYASKTAIAGPSPRPLLSSQQDLTSSMSVPTMSLRNSEINPSSAQRPDTFMSDYSKYPDEDLEEFVSVHPTHTLQHQEQDNQGDEGSTSGKKGIFNTKFKFGNSSK